MTPDISRRNLLRGGLGAAATGMVAGLSAPASSTPATAQSPARTDAEIYGVTTVNPLIEQRADPFVTHPVGGRYYFTGSVPEYDRVVVRGATTIAGLATAAESVIWRRPASGRLGGHIWAPELHRIGGNWYVYFAAGDSDDVFRIRMYVLSSALADPRDPAGWQLRGQITTEWDGFSLDATTFEHRGRRYLVWAQSEPEIDVNTSLYIAEMDTPLSIATRPVRLSTPTRGWEVQGFAVNEGPAVIVRNGRVFLTFSASATDARYCMGLLTASDRADLLDRRSWVKTTEPVFGTNEQTSRYGPGHNSFTVAEDGVTDVLVYHARDYRDITGDPLNDPNRHTRVQRLYWHRDGTPMFGVPIGVGGPIVRLSPADARTAFVRHTGADAGFVVRVDTGVRELADTQFRFVPGLAGDASEAIRSVNFPDRYLRIVDGAARLDPLQTSFHRVPRASGGVSIRLAGDPDAYLRHEEGRLAVGGRTAPGTAFVLS